MAKFLMLTGLQKGNKVIVAIDKIQGVVEQLSDFGSGQTTCAIFLSREVIFVKNSMEEIGKALSLST